MHTRDLTGTDSARRQQQRLLAVQRLLTHNQPEKLRGNAALLADRLAEPLHGPAERDTAECCRRPVTSTISSSTVGGGSTDHTARPRLLSWTGCSAVCAAPSKRTKWLLGPKRR